MADVQDDLEDSRTLLAGRKRDFQEASQGQDTSSSLQLAEDSTSNKRIKSIPSNELMESSHLTNEQIQRTTSPVLPVPVAEVPLNINPQVEKPSSSMEPPATSPTGPEMPSPVVQSAAVEPNTNPRQQTDVQGGIRNAPRTSWNTGVQSGLRTSFTAKKMGSISSRNLLQAANNTQDAETSLEGTPPTNMGTDKPSQGQNSNGSGDDDQAMARSQDANEEEQTFGGANTSDTKPKKVRKRKAKNSRNVSEVEDGGESQNLPFKPLKYRDLQVLSAAERAAYKKARKQDPNEQRKKAERKELRRQRKAIKNQVTTENDAEKGIDKFQKAQAETAVVTDLLAKERKWPLPSIYAGMIRLIDKGHTFYPRKFGCKAVHKVNKHNFAMSLVLENGMPVVFQDVSFRAFAIMFLESNMDQWAALRPRSLVSAFNDYMAFYYADHLYDHEFKRTKILEMVSGDNALTLDEAKDLVKQKIELAASQPPESKAQDTSQPVAPQAEKVPAMEGDDFIMLEDDETSEDDELSSCSSTSSDAQVANLDLDERQLSLQGKYFPSSTGTTTETGYCLACSRVGHDCSNCPALSCQSCGESHSTFRCPQRQRCSKCRERGHSRDLCPEKLGVPKSEMSCDYCNSTEHLEAGCHQLWRSFDPTSDKIRTVQNIIVDCYNCGGSSHFGPECGLHTGRGLLTGGVTWSKKNLSKYVDPTCDRRALSAGVDYTIPSKSKFSIKGKANNPITFDDSSDDDAESFIRPKIQPPGRGNIRFNGTQEQRPMANLPRRPVSPVAPYRNGYDGGFRAGDDPRHGMSFDRYYPSAHQSRPQVGGERGGDNYKPPLKRSESGGYGGRGPKAGASKGGRGRGRGR
jgi:hypothetical protein